MTTCANLSPAPGAALPYACELEAGHEGAHRAGSTEWIHHAPVGRVTKVAPTTADGLLRLALAVERLAAAIERHR